MIYLDSAATTLQKPARVSHAAAWAVDHLASPGRGGHPPAARAAQTAFACREEAAKLFHLKEPDRIVFTFNATHALNLAIRSVVREGDTVVISGYEHNAVTRTLAAMPGVTVRVAQSALFDRAGTLEAFTRAITPEVTAVVCTHVSNVFGFILPIEDIARLCRMRGVRLIVDAAQSAGCLPLDAGALGADFIAMPGHKGLMGPQGTGLLLCQGDPQPLLYGGTGSESLHQEMPGFLPDRLEAGTHNLVGIAGLLEGLRFVHRRGVGAIARYEGELIQELAQMLAEQRGLEVYRSPVPGAQAGVLSFRVADMDCEEVGERLGEQGICVRAGLHCAPLAHSTAGTLESGTVRASVSPFTTHGELRALCRAVSTIGRESK